MNYTEIVASRNVRQNPGQARVGNRMKTLFIFCTVFFLKVQSRQIDSLCPPGLLSTVNSKYIQTRDGSCFHFVVSRWRTYSKANEDCNKHGGTLALPKTKSLNDFLTDQLLNTYGQFEEAWIGLQDRKDETKFVWEDNSELGWNNFAPGNGPDNDWIVRGVEDCVALNPEKDGLWYDHQCDSNLLSWATRANPSKIYICQYTMSPRIDVVDFPTGVRMASNTSKAVSVNETCPTGLLSAVGSQYLQVWSGLCFHFVISRWRTYSKANKDCNKHGGTLALPKTKSLNDFLTDQLLNVYGQFEEAWIGLQDRKDETKFVWEDNSELGWNNFAPGNGPDNDWIDMTVPQLAPSAMMLSIESLQRSR
ncbi:macrophage mannose receptor 1-like [Elysia marginata]|uniref:Macrophage mannose receptor 1-like n=1 Tax=Elysia marginata TaxID=1093978 RepID=A0AAV4HHR1_9GAST|nr:macrophage mannose receptor 1-like [Elysia marginata]